jgi:hypothetical protein
MAIMKGLNVAKSFKYSEETGLHSRFFHICGKYYAPALILARLNPQTPQKNEAISLETTPAVSFDFLRF